MKGYSFELLKDEFRKYVSAIESNDEVYDSPMKTTPEENRCAKLVNDVLRGESNDIKLLGSARSRCIVAYYRPPEGDIVNFIVITTSSSSTGFFPCGELDIDGGEVSRFEAMFRGVMSAADGYFNVETAEFVQRVAQEAVHLVKTTVPNTEPKVPKVRHSANTTQKVGEGTPLRLLEALVKTVSQLHFHNSLPPIEVRKIVVSFLLWKLENTSQDIEGRPLSTYTDLLHFVSQYSYTLLSEVGSKYDFRETAKYLRQKGEEMKQLYVDYNNVGNCNIANRQETKTLLVSGLKLHEITHQGSRTPEAIRNTALLNSGKLLGGSSFYHCMQIESFLFNALVAPNPPTSDTCRVAMEYIYSYQTKSNDRVGAHQLPKEEWESSVVVVVWMGYCVLHRYVSLSNYFIIKLSTWFLIS